MGGVLFNKSKFLISTVTTSSDGTTEHTEDKGLGVNISCTSASALCQTGNNDGKSWNFPSYLYLREIQPFEPVSLERSDFEEQQENGGKQDEEEDGILKNDSPSDDDDIPSLEQEADFYLERGFRFGKSIRFNSRIVFS